MHIYMYIFRIQNISPNPWAMVDCEAWFMISSRLTVIEGQVFYFIFLWRLPNLFLPAQVALFNDVIVHWGSSKILWHLCLFFTCSAIEPSTAFSDTSCLRPHRGALFLFHLTMGHQWVWNHQTDEVSRLPGGRAAYKWTHFCATWQKPRPLTMKPGAHRLTWYSCKAAWLTSMACLLLQVTVTKSSTLT